MNTTEPLTGPHLQAYNAIFQHPISHKLEWRHVRPLFERMGTVVEEPNGNLRVTRNGVVHVIHPPRTKEVGVDELMELRHFIERSDKAAPSLPDEGEHWLVVIDHREARLFRSLAHGSIPVQVLPHDPDDYFRHAAHSKEFTRGKEKPDPNSFFEPVALALAPPGSILVVGTGTGTSSEADQFLGWLRTNHPETSARVLGSLVVDESHLSTGQILAQAREFFLRAGMPTGS